MNDEQIEKAIDVNEDTRHGIDGWGLETFSRGEDGYGYYVYERTTKGKTETREVIRYLGPRRADA